MSAQTLAVTFRSGRRECEHRGSIALCDASGALVESYGDPEEATYMRSSAKPFQAAVCLASGAADAYRWTDAEVAIVCASHSAEPEQKNLVYSILGKAGLDVEDLQCGAHPPLGESARDELVRRGLLPGPIDSNCSGKHAGMLAVCKHRGWPTSGYRRPDHPLQLANGALLARFAGSKADPPTGVDGCGVPSFFISVREMATAFARLANPDSLSADDGPTAARVLRAMTANPRLIAGRGRLDTLLGEFAGERIVVKSGAEGVFCCGFPGKGLGLAVKIADGNARPHPAIIVRFFERLLPELPWGEWSKSTNPPLLNSRREEVGVIQAVF